MSRNWRLLDRGQGLGTLPYYYYYYYYYSTSISI